MDHRVRYRDASERRLLVISQRTDRTGAPVQLAVLLDGLQQESGMRITVLLGSFGVIGPELASHAARVKREPWMLRALAAAGRRAPGRHAPPPGASREQPPGHPPAAAIARDRPLTETHLVGGM